MGLQAGEPVESLGEGSVPGVQHDQLLIWGEEFELAEPGQELGVVASLFSWQIGQQVVQQLLAHVGEFVDQLGRPPLLRMRRLHHHGACLLEAAQRGIERIVVQDESGDGLHPLAQLVAMRRALGQVPENQDVDVGR